MSTVFDTIREKIETYLAANWDEEAQCPIKWPNEPFADHEQTAYVQYNLNYSDVHRFTLTGTPTAGQRQLGLVTMQIFVREASGTGTAMELADDVRDLFNEVDLAMGDGTFIRFDAPSINVVGNSSPGWWQVNVDCPFEHVD